MTDPVVPDSVVPKSAALPPPSSKKRGPFRFFLRGLAISLPAILTIVIVAWLLRGVNGYVLQPATTAVRYAIGTFLDDSIKADQLRNVRRDGERGGVQVGRVGEGAAAETYVVLGPRAVPLADYEAVIKETLPGEEPNSARGLYGRLAEQRHFGSFLGLNVITIAAILALLYFLGRFVSAKIGHWVVTQFETNVLGRLPVIRNVYGAVKQVTDFLFSESQVEYRRVIAIEYPRRGIWSLGLVTGESMLQIAGRAGEPCLSVLIPSSPMPVTGYTINVLRSEVLDLEVTVDQAFQFCISCGVLVPPQQKPTPESLRKILEGRLAEFGAQAPVGVAGAGTAGETAAE